MKLAKPPQEITDAYAFRMNNPPEEEKAGRMTNDTRA